MITIVAAIWAIFVAVDIYDYDNSFYYWLSSFI
jgi:hypothetical protein